MRLNSAVVTAGFFEVLGVQPALGRTFSSAEERDGANSVLILSHGLWQRRFGGDPNILGRALMLDRTPTTVIGVMPADFNFPAGAELWRPLAFGAAHNSVRRFHSLRPIGRLKPGVSIAQALAEVNTIAVALENAADPVWRDSHGCDNVCRGRRVAAGGGCRCLLDSSATRSARRSANRASTWVGATRWVSCAGALVSCPRRSCHLYLRFGSRDLLLHLAF